MSDVPAAKLRSNAFTKYWVNYDAGVITVGMGDPGSDTCHTWADPEPIRSIQHIGLSAWDKHVGYRSIHMHPPLRLDTAAAGKAGAGGEASNAPAVATLFELCCRALLAGLTPANVCSVLEVADCLSPVLDGLRPQAIDFLARLFGEAVAADLPGFSRLSAWSLAEVLCSASLGCQEKAVFDAVVLWAGYGEEIRDEGSACRPLQASWWQSCSTSACPRRSTPPGRWRCMM